jgi:hypothetical protein
MVRFPLPRFSITSVEKRWREKEISWFESFIVYLRGNLLEHVKHVDNPWLL